MKKRNLHPQELRTPDDGPLRYLLTAYLFDNISKDGRKEVEEHLEGSAESRAELAELERTLESIEDALSDEDEEPETYSFEARRLERVLAAANHNLPWYRTRGFLAVAAALFLGLLPLLLFFSSGNTDRGFPVGVFSSNGTDRGFPAGAIADRNPRRPVPAMEARSVRIDALARRSSGDRKSTASAATEEINASHDHGAPAEELAAATTDLRALVAGPSHQKADATEAEALEEAARSRQSGEKKAAREMRRSPRRGRAKQKEEARQNESRFYTVPPARGQEVQENIRLESAAQPETSPESEAAPAIEGWSYGVNAIPQQQSQLGAQRGSDTNGNGAPPPASPPADTLVIKDTRNNSQFALDLSGVEAARKSLNEASNGALALRSLEEKAAADTVSSLTITGGNRDLETFAAPSTPQDPIRIQGRWMVVDDDVPSDQLGDFGTTATNNWARKPRSGRVHANNLAIPGEDGIINTPDDRILMSGGGSEARLKGEEPTNPSAVILVPPFANERTPSPTGGRIAGPGKGFGGVAGGIAGGVVADIDGEGKSVSPGFEYTDNEGDFNSRIASLGDLTQPLGSRVDPYDVAASSPADMSDAIALDELAEKPAVELDFGAFDPNAKRQANGRAQRPLSTDREKNAELLAKSFTEATTKTRARGRASQAARTDGLATVLEEDLDEQEAEADRPQVLREQLRGELGVAGGTEFRVTESRDDEDADGMLPLARNADRYAGRIVQKDQPADGKSTGAFQDAIRELTEHYARTPDESVPQLRQRAPSTEPEAAGKLLGRVERVEKLAGGSLYERNLKRLQAAPAEPETGEAIALGYRGLQMADMPQQAVADSHRAIEKQARAYAYYWGLDKGVTFEQTSRLEVPPPTIGDEGLGQEAFRERYGVNPFVQTALDHQSTFAMDVDTASFTRTRDTLRSGKLPETGSVRVEEFVNYFRQDYPAAPDTVFSVFSEGGPSPFGAGVELLKVTVKARELREGERKDALLTLCIDTSGSMFIDRRLGLVQRALSTLLDGLGPEDRVAIVAYNAQAYLAIPHTSAREKERLLGAIASLTPGGASNVEAGLELAYRVADDVFEPRALNRVMLLSDGVATVGARGPEKILEKVKVYARRGIYLSSVGFGRQRYNDAMMERLANEGNGRYDFISSTQEARHIFAQNLPATLQVLAQDAKIQVEFDPTVVASYRLLGYENRAIKDHQFRDDKVDAGEVGPGTTVTALYEILRRPNAHGTLGRIFVRYRDTGTGRVDELDFPLASSAVQPELAATSDLFRFIACAAETAELLRESYWARDGSYSRVLETLEGISAEFRAGPQWSELRDVARSARHLTIPRLTNHPRTQQSPQKTK